MNNFLVFRCERFRFKLETQPPLDFLHTGSVNLSQHDFLCDEPDIPGCSLFSHPPPLPCWQATPPPVFLSVISLMTPTTPTLVSWATSAWHLVRKAAYLWGRSEASASCTHTFNVSIHFIIYLTHFYCLLFLIRVLMSHPVVAWPGHHPTTQGARAHTHTHYSACFCSVGVNWSTWRNSTLVQTLCWTPEYWDRLRYSTCPW